MKVLVIFLLSLLALFADALTITSTTCPILGATDKAVVDSWITALRAAQTAAEANSILSTTFGSSTPTAQDLCTSSTLKTTVVCREDSNGECRITLLNFGSTNLRSFPSILKGLPFLQNLQLDQARISSLPADVVEFPSLTSLNVDSQKSPFFAGTIPAFLGNLPTLEAFSASGNRLTGSIPDSLLLLPNLKVLQLNRNQLSVIDNIFSASTNFPAIQDLQLSTNQIAGTLSTKIGFFVDTLNILQLDDNQFIGTIPTQIEKPSGGLYAILNLAFNQWCPLLNYESFGATDYADNVPVTCDPVPYYIKAVTASSPATATTRSKIYVTFVGSKGTTSEAYVRKGFDTSNNNEWILVNADIDVGVVWSVYFRYARPTDTWTVNEIQVYHYGLTATFRSRVAIRNNDFLEAPFQLIVHTTKPSSARAYATLRDVTGDHQNHNYNGAVSAGTTTSTLIGFNLDNIATVDLGHFSNLPTNKWLVSDVVIHKRDKTYTFDFSNSVVYRSTTPVPVANPVITPRTITDPAEDLTPPTGTVVGPFFDV